LKDTFDSLGTIILIGEVQSSKGSRLYVVAVVLEEDSTFQDSAGIALRPFIPLDVNENYQDALRFAAGRAHDPQPAGAQITDVQAIRREISKLP